MRKIDFHFGNEFKKWLAANPKANELSTLSGTGQPYLQNRLDRAFMAGAVAMQAAYEKAQNPNPRTKKEPIKKDIGKIELEVIERFIPEPKPKRIYFR